MAAALAVAAALPAGAPAAAAILWRPCPFFTPIAPMPGVPAPAPPPTSARAECANVSVPLDWGEPAGRTTTVFVKRALAAARPPRGEVWLLPGGPGAPGVGLEAPALDLLAGGAEYDFVIPDFRGTGRSAALRCADGSYTPTAACAASIDPAVLRHMTMDNAARDVAHIAAATKRPGRKLVLVGTSFGTYWVNRVLIHAGGAVDAVAMDGLCPPDVCRFGPRYDANTNAAGVDLLSRCVRESARCRELLGEYPSATAAVQWQLLDAGAHPCAPGAVAGQRTTVLLRQGLGNLGHDVASQVMLPAVVARLARCSPADRRQLRALLGNLSAELGPGVPFYSDPMQLNAISFKHTLLSEAWEDAAASDDYVAGALHQLHFALDLSAGLPGNPWPAADIAAWPRYSLPTDYSAYANYSGPLLLLHGRLDPDCSFGWAEHARARWAAGPATSRAVFVPNSGHVTMAQSPIKGGTAQCGMALVASYLSSLDPAAVDTSCLAEVPPPDFDGTTEATQQLLLSQLGTKRMWD